MRFGRFYHCSFLLLAVVLSAPANGQAVAEAPEQAAESATTESAAILQRVTEDIRYLASDELAGREPGTEGIEKAAKHIEKLYKEIGLKPLKDGTYRQNFDVRKGLQLNTEDTFLTLKSGDQEWKLELEKEFLAQASPRGFDWDAELAFVGYGISADNLNYNEYADVDVEDKVVVVIRREPQQDDEESVFSGTEVSRHAYIRTKTRQARKAGAVGMIIVNDSFSAPDRERDELDLARGPGGGFPIVQMKQATFEKLLAKTPIFDPTGKKLTRLKEIEANIDESLSPISQPLPGWKISASASAKVNMATTANIIGVIEGEGPLANETIVIGGHYDHLGMGNFGSRSNRREIHNGADDNATGTAAVMELARRYAARDKKPARRLVFVCFSAEEMGLLGARHYVSEPVFELEKTATMVNFDMIGWLRDEQLTIFNSNSATEFDTLLDRANEDIDLALTKSTGFGGSDHLPFYQNSIPVMFIHTGLTSTYHTPEDDFESIDCKGAVRVINYSEKVVDELLALPARPTFQGQQTRRNRAPRISMGWLIDQDVEGGVMITDIKEGSLAEKYKFKVNDVITEVATKKVDKRRQLNLVLRRETGKTVIFKLKRGEENVEIVVELKQGESPAGG